MHRVRKHGILTPSEGQLRSLARNTDSLSRISKSQNKGRQKTKEGRGTTLSNTQRCKERIFLVALNEIGTMVSVKHVPERNVRTQKMITFQRAYIM